MFNFTHVLNVTTRERYYIDKAVLNDNGEGYDETPMGENAFEIDLQPESLEGKPIVGIDLVVSNSDKWVNISKNHCNTTVEQDDGTSYAELAEALIEGKTIVVTNQ